MNSMKRLVAITWLVLAGVAVVGIPQNVEARPSERPATGCTRAAGASVVCIHTTAIKKGVYVPHVRVDRLMGNITSTSCNYVVRLYVKDENDNIVFDETNRDGEKHCSGPRAWIDFYPEREFPNNSQLCGEWNDSDVSGITACITIKKRRFI